MDWIWIMLIAFFFLCIVVYAIYMTREALRGDNCTISKVLVVLNCVAGIGICVWYTCTIIPNRPIKLTAPDGSEFSIGSLLGLCITWLLLSFRIVMLPAVVSINVPVICAAKKNGIQVLKIGYVPPGIGAGLRSSIYVSMAASAYALMLFSLGLIESAL